jgi:hypothetical protein
MERSIFATRNCFTENLIKMKWLNDTEYKILDDLFQISTDQGSYHVDLFSKSTDTPSTYLRTDLSECMKRLQARQRPGEETISQIFIISTKSGFVRTKTYHKRKYNANCNDYRHTILQSKINLINKTFYTL